MGLTHTVSGDVAHFRTPSRVPITSLKLHCYPKQEGSGDPSPTNVRPIHGWAELNLNRCHKNLIKPYYTEETTLNGVTLTPTTNGVKAYGTASTEFAVRLSSMDVRFLDEGEKYTFSLYVNGDISGCKDPYIGYNDGAGYWGTMCSLTQSNNYKYVWTVPQRYASAIAPWFDMYIRIKEGSVVDFEIGLQMETGGNATSYEPFSKEIYHAEATGGTPAGGYLDMISGVFYIEISGLTNPVIASANTLSSGYKVWLMTGGIQAPQMTSLNINEYYSSMYKSKAVSALTELTPGEYTIISKRIVVCPHDEQQSLTKEQANEWLHGFKCTFLYPLLTSTTFQFFNGIELKSYLDHNNFWSDANDITEVSYEVTESKDIQAARKRFEAEEDGHHKLVRWNQISLDGNFQDTNYSNWQWNANFGAFQIHDGVATWTANQSPSAYYATGFTRKVNYLLIPYNHKILVSAKMRTSAYDSTLQFRIYAMVTSMGGAHTYFYKDNVQAADTWQTVRGFISDRPETPPSGFDDVIIKKFKPLLCKSNHGSYEGIVDDGTTMDVKELMAFDLTEMFGLGNEPQTVEEFERICEINGIDLTTYQPYDSGSDRWLIVP